MSQWLDFLHEFSVVKIMTGFIFHADCVKHNPGPGHPERPERLLRIKEAYDDLSQREKTFLLTPRAAALEEISRVHSEIHISRMEKICLNQGYHPRMESELNQASWNAALLAAGGGIEACEKVASGEWQNAFCAVRPPGHHATADEAMGFCIFNNIAIAAAHLLTIGVEKIAIIDWDVHHGNGTQEAFYQSDRVFFYSIHQRNLYPYLSGLEEQTGAGIGEGFTLNRPLEPGTSGDDQLSVFLQDMERIEREFRPEFALVSCGFDSCAGDSIGSLNLQNHHYQEMTVAVSRIAKGKLVSFLEGGYNLKLLGGLFRTHFETMVKLNDR